MIRIVGFAFFLGHFICVAGCLAEYDVAPYWTDLSDHPKTVAKRGFGDVRTRLAIPLPAGTVVSDMQVSVSLGCPTLLVDFRKK